MVVKAAVKKQAKASTKITIALPDELLEWADQMAVVRRLERNDVIRMALANGLLLLQMETLRLTSDEKAMADDYASAVDGVEGFKERVRASIAHDAAEAAKLR